MTSEQHVDEALKTLEAITGSDVVEAHAQADRALIAFLDATHPEVSAAWRQLQDRYDGFGYSE